MRRIRKDITKHYQMACNSFSYTPFAFYGLMFVMCLLWRSRYLVGIRVAKNGINSELCSHEDECTKHTGVGGAAGADT